MNPIRPTVLLLPLLVACGGGSGTWEITTWGEEYIEHEIPAAAFEDGCSATFDQFLIIVSDAALVDGDGTDVATMDGPLVFDMALSGPHAIASVVAPAGHYDEARFAIAPASGATPGNVDASVASAFAASGDSVRASGSLTCGGETRAFDWSFDTGTTYHCEPEDLTLAAMGTAFTQLTVHGDHFFYDDLAAEDAVVRGQAIFDAGGDDGDITQTELAAVQVASLGFGVGPYSDVTDLGGFVSFLTRTLGHVDGEGHCQVDL